MATGARLRLMIRLSLRPVPSRTCSNCPRGGQKSFCARARAEILFVRPSSSSVARSGAALGTLSGFQDLAEPAQCFDSGSRGRSRSASARVTVGGALALDGGLEVLDNERSPRGRLELLVGLVGTGCRKTGSGPTS